MTVLSTSAHVPFTMHRNYWLTTVELDPLNTLTVHHGRRRRFTLDTDRNCTCYLADLLTPASEVASRLRLRSANRHQLIVPRCPLSTYGRRAFSIAGPTVWNSLPDELIDPARSFDSFLRQSFLTFTSVTSALEVF